MEEIFNDNLVTPIVNDNSSATGILMEEAKNAPGQSTFNFIGFYIESYKTIFIYFGKPESPIWDIMGKNNILHTTIGRCALSGQIPLSPV